MRLHRFIGDYDLSQKIVKITNLENIKQIKGVLRLEVGDFLILCNGRGTEAKVEINKMTKNEIEVKIVEKIKKENNAKRVSLYLAILKKENFEFAVGKAVEVGVNEIIPIITERTVKTGLNTERLNKIIREASEQSGRSVLPTLHPILKFEDAIKQIDGTPAVIFDLSGEEYKPNQNTQHVSIFIGPEGGFTEKEILEAREAQISVALLGENTLRAETAAIVATYKVLNN